MSNDKTRQKLMESMRMTKSDSGKKTEEVAPKAKAKPQAEKPAAKKVAEKKKEAKKPAKASADAYQSAQRVWPD